MESFFESDDEDCFLGMAICKAIALVLGSLIRKKKEKNMVMCDCMI